MKKGLLYIIFDFLINLLKYVNIVELFKFISCKAYPRNKILALRAGVDIFIILKWSFILILWINNVKSEWINLIIYYLIYSNIYTYFYYHSWTKDLDNSNYDSDRIRRRFLSLLLAIGFNIFSFAYLFALPFLSHFSVSKIDKGSLAFIKYSFSNTLITSYNSIQSITHIGHTLALYETIISFIFFTVILSNSIPQIKNQENGI